jgi:hypothetical protein
MPTIDEITRFCMTLEKTVKVNKPKQVKAKIPTNAPTSSATLNTQNVN